MPMTWNEQADAKLLLAILHTTNAKLDYPALAEYMGPECTDVAVKIRIQRLKKKVNESNPVNPGGASGEGDGVGEGSGSAPVTPQKRGKGVKKGPSKKVKGEEGGVEKTEVTEEV